MELLVFGTAGAPHHCVSDVHGPLFRLRRSWYDPAHRRTLRVRPATGNLRGQRRKESWTTGASIQIPSLAPHTITIAIWSRKWFLSSVPGTSNSLITTGCSFGGYHTINFAMRHPEHATGPSAWGQHSTSTSSSTATTTKTAISIVLRISCRTSPTRFWTALSLSGWCSRPASRYLRSSRHRFGGVLRRKHLPTVLDVWGDGTGHDWPWWQKMAVKLLIP